MAATFVSVGLVLDPAAAFRIDGWWAGQREGLGMVDVEMGDWTRFTIQGSPDALRGLAGALTSAANLAGPPADAPDLRGSLSNPEAGP
jgi:hypothetical protein